MFRKIYASLIEKYDETDYKQFQQVKIILAVILLALVFLFLSFLYYNFVQYKPVVIYAVSASFILHILYLYMLKKGHIEIVAQASIITNLTMIWTAVFSQGGPVIHRLDTIFIIFGVLALTPLIDRKKGYYILAYYLVNIIILAILLFTLYSQKIMLARSVIAFSADALTGLLFSGSISFLIYNINLQMHERDKAKEMQLINKKEELEATNEELTASMEELEATSEELFASMDQMETTNHALEEEKERLLVTLRSINEGVITIDTEKKIVLMNPAAEDLTGIGLSEAAGKPLKEIFITGNSEETAPLSGTSAIPRNRMLLYRKGNNQEYIIETSTAPIKNSTGESIGSVIVFRDITYKTFIEKELNKIRQLESLGLLAGGIAHDFNNLLSSVLGNISLAALKDISSEDRNQCMEDAQKALIHARELTGQLLTFSKGGMPVRKTASVKTVIEDSVRFTLRGSNIIFKMNFAENLWNGIIDTSQISQVIQNLIINSQQAMPGGGEININVENSLISRENEMLMSEGNYIVIKIKDTGTGIDKKILPDIFNPYFTTKKSGHGLGLSLVYSIVKKHSGYIFADSEPGKGTTFTIYLPATDQPEKTGKEGAAYDFPGGKKILFMDDDNEIRKMAVKMIKLLNCEVTTVPDGESAITVFKEEYSKGSPFDAAILDITIPGGVGGKEAIQNILAIDPLIKAVVSTGYSNSPLVSEFKEHGFSAVIKKPYTFDELVKTMNDIFRN